MLSELSISRMILLVLVFAIAEDIQIEFNLASAPRFSSVVSISVSKRLIALLAAALLLVALRLTTALIAGSRASRSAHLTLNTPHLAAYGLFAEYFSSPLGSRKRAI